MHFLQWKSLLPHPKMGLWDISKFERVEKKGVCLYLLWLKCGRVFTWKWRGNLVPWGLLHSLKIRLTWDLKWKHSEFILLFPYNLFYRAFERKKFKSLQTSRLWSVIRGNRKSIQCIELRYFKFFKIISVPLFLSLPLLQKDYVTFFSHYLVDSHFRRFWVEEGFCYNWILITYILFAQYLELCRRIFILRHITRYIWRKNPLGVFWTI